ncbi:OsmC family protein [Actinacidiphila paucisporea]|uniref:Organic hydroperoxide reductase OsmC/OhrA n=1 Tax=Actinacidiphila paucisporea TaxID=310782 RepID=A0A1M6XCY9_9ACTN|nr:OsmC family protein [Actinacidiphila paucisporea]SHL03783.1 Organic hydroperoxide reductase OsmC/OhrA [Actinacidiphila paucisporea]
MASANTHTYRTGLRWTGNLGSGTSTYRAYERAHEVSAPGVPVLLGSSDPAFRGDASRWNPELLLLAALSECHMLAYLHLCAVNGVTVTAYTDQAAGTMTQTPDGGGHFTDALLSPVVEVADEATVEKATALHADAHRLCFIASSVNFPVRHAPTVTVRPLG